VLHAVICLAVAVPLVAAGVVTIALGSCHDAGGFCTGEWDVWQHGVEFFGGGVLLLVAGVVVATLGVSRRPRTAIIVGVVSAALALAVIVAGESSRGRHEAVRRCENHRPLPCPPESLGHGLVLVDGPRQSSSAPKTNRSADRPRTRATMPGR
jgi:hypothetical protein